MQNQKPSNQPQQQPIGFGYKKVKVGTHYGTTTCLDVPGVGLVSID